MQKDAFYTCVLNRSGLPLLQTQGGSPRGNDMNAATNNTTETLKAELMECGHAGLRAALRVLGHGVDMHGIAAMLGGDVSALLDVLNYDGQTADAVTLLRLTGMPPADSLSDWNADSLLCVRAFGCVPVSALERYDRDDVKVAHKAAKAAHAYADAVKASAAA